MLALGDTAQLKFTEMIGPPRGLRWLYRALPPNACSYPMGGVCSIAPFSVTPCYMTSLQGALWPGIFLLYIIMDSHRTIGHHSTQTLVLNIARYSCTIRLTCNLKGTSSQNPQNSSTWRSELVPLTCRGN